jgi:hypothetical protein
MVVKTRFLRRSNVAPLPESAPVDAMAEWLAQLIEELGHLEHWRADAAIRKRFGDGFNYSEPIYDKRGRFLRDRYLLHPDILFALKKLTGNNIIWGKDCHEWWAKSARGRQAASDRRQTRRYMDNLQKGGYMATVRKE